MRLRGQLVMTSPVRYPATASSLPVNWAMKPWESSPERSASAANRSPIAHPFGPGDQDRDLLRGVPDRRRAGGSWRPGRRSAGPGPSTRCAPPGLRTQDDNSVVFPNPGRRDDDHELPGPGLVERVEQVAARDERRRQFRHRDLALRDRIRRHPATSIISCPRPGPRLGPLRPVAGPAGDAGDLLRRRRVAPGQWALDRSTASAEAEPDGTAARGPAADRRGPT